MDLDNLRAFISVARRRSFSLASEDLFITQPAVSKRVAALEEQIGASLFDRLGKNIQLTQAGQVLLPRAEQIVRQLEEARQVIADLSGDVRGELKVATSHHLGLHKLPPVLRAFASAYPLVNLKFEFLDSEVALERVQRGLCELAVVTLAPEPVEQLEFEILWQDQLRFVTGLKSELPDNTNMIALSEAPAILPDLSTYTGRLVKRCFDERHLPLSINMTTNYLETIKMMVSVGLGWSVLPESMLDDNIRSLRLGGVSLTRNLGVARHHKRQLSNAAEAFYDVLRANRALASAASHRDERFSDI
ncbi:MAG: LysR family transcriptional regulator [Cellvibrionaceae bacterium]|nr:LysR family transcriptional regulator [Cellvibrionaceae bacterium]